MAQFRIFPHAFLEIPIPSIHLPLTSLPGPLHAEAASCGKEKITRVIFFVSMLLDSFSCMPPGGQKKPDMLGVMTNQKCPVFFVHREHAKSTYLFAALPTV